MRLIINITFVMVLALFCGWLATRAWHMRRGLVKWPGLVVSGLLAVLLALAGGVALLGLYKLNVPESSSAPNIQIAGLPEQRARGERLANLCVICHSSTGQLPLDGGTENIMAGLGTLYAPNLTPDGPLQGWTDGEIIRAIREGVHKKGRSLLIMPSDQYYIMSDADVQSLVAYLRAQPAVDRQTPETQLNLFGAVLVGAGMFPLSTQRPNTAFAERSSAGPPPEYGRYLVTISGCGACHGEDLRGGTSPFTPIGPNLPAIISRWSADRFVETIRTGVDPFGHSINPETMPWQNFSAAFTDEELKAIYEYILTINPE